MKNPTDLNDLNGLIAGSSQSEYSTCNDTSTNFTVASFLKAVSPQDKYYQGYIAVLLLGIGSFFTFMVVASAPDYIEVVYGNYPNLMYLVVSIYNTADMVGLLFMLSPAGSYFAIKTRILFGYSFTALFTLFIPLIPYLLISEYHQMLLFLIFAGVLSGLSSALCSVSLFSFSAMFPPTYLITAFSGQAFSGILSVFIRIINKALFDTDINGTKQSGIGYFAFATFIYILGAILFKFVHKTPFVQTHLVRYYAVRDSQFLLKPYEPQIKSNSSPIKIRQNDPEFDHTSHLHSDFVDPASAHSAMTNSNLSDHDDYISAHDKLIEMQMSIVTTTTATTTAPTMNNTIDNTCTMDQLQDNYNQIIAQQIARKQSKKRSAALLKYDYTTAIKQTYKCLLSIFIGYCATYLVYPSLIVDVKINNRNLMETKWSGVINIGVWAISYWIGIGIHIFAPNKLICLKYDNLWIIQLVWAICTYPLFLAANQEWIDNDVYVYFIVSICPFVYGFLCARTYSILPTRVDIFGTEIAQATTQFVVMSGIVIGSWIAYGVSFKLA